MINTYHPITIHYIYTPSPLCHRHPNPIASLSMVLKKTRGIPECTLPPTSSNLWLTPPPTSSHPWHHHTHPLLRPSKTGAKWNLSTTQRPAVKNPLYILTCVYLFTASVLTSPHAPFTQACQDWGQVMRTQYQKTSAARNADLMNNYLGYWTDRGAYYYYNTAHKNATYEQTLLDIHAYNRKSNIPYRLIICLWLRARISK